jgi:ubiquinone biosynthesis protein
MVNHQKAQAGRTRRRLLITVLAGLGAIATALPAAGVNLQEVPSHSWILIAIASWAWLSQ